jgi:hypothetical protein
MRDARREVLRVTLADVVLEGATILTGVSSTAVSLCRRKRHLAE